MCDIISIQSQTRPSKCIQYQCLQLRALQRDLVNLDGSASLGHLSQGQTVGRWVPECVGAAFSTQGLSKQKMPPRCSQISSGNITRGQRTIEMLWRKFFSDPSQWWDHREEKLNARYPDFKHKSTKETLWLNGSFKPPWVETELAAMGPRTMQSDTFPWNVRLARSVKDGQYKKTLELFEQLQRECMTPDTFTFVPVLNACASLRALGDGRRIHTKIIQSGCESDVYVGSSLIDMYTKCGSLEDAQGVFIKMPTRNVISWNAMILGYVKGGEAQKALDLSRKMQLEGVDPTPFSFVGVLNACAAVAALEDGRRVHEQIIQRGWESSVFLGSCLVDMYAKCGSIDDAWNAFNKIPTRNVVVWNAMIFGCVKCGQGQKALELSRQMNEEGIEPNPTTFVGMLNACAHVALIEEGRRVHSQIIQRGLQSNAAVCNSLLDMYAKCGSIEDAGSVFNKMPNPDMISWTAMLGGYAMHGYSQEALEHFERMRQQGVTLNGVTFLSLLSACSRAGLVDEGLHYFEYMTAALGISETVEHCICMVDLLCRAGRLHEAEDLVNSTLSDPDATQWMPLLSASRIYGNVEIGERIAKLVLKVEPENAAGYVMLSSIYAMAEKWGELATARLEVERSVSKYHSVDVLAQCLESY